MDTKKEDTDAQTALEAPAMPAPGEPRAGSGAVPSVPLHGPGDVVKHLGGGQPPSLPWHARPQTHEIQDFFSNLGISKEFWDPCLGHDTIWRPGQEMQVYVDNNKHVDK